MTLPVPGHDTTSQSDEDEPISYITYHLFPRPLDLLRPAGEANVVEQLETTLRTLGFGYRAGFISSSLNTLINAHGTLEERAAIGVPLMSSPSSSPSAPGEVEVKGVQGVEAFLQSLRQGGVRDSVSREEDRWRGELLALKGVGRKVADCIGLMSLDRVCLPPRLCEKQR